MRRHKERLNNERMPRIVYNVNVYEPNILADGGFC